MSITVTLPSTNQFATAPNIPPRIPLTRQHYYLLFDAGLIPQQCELIDGEIIEKMPQGPQHTQALRRTERVMRRIFGEDYVFSQSPLILGVNDELEPDVFITSLPDTAFAQSHPTVTDSHLAIEISVSTLDFDKGKKASRYAIAGVGDYWVVDVENRRLLVFRNPFNGVYPGPQELDETQSVAPLAASNATILVADLLP